MNIVERLRSPLMEWATQPAIISAQRSLIRYTELDQAAARLATGLRDHGLKPGDRALVWQPVSIELYITVLGLWRLGMVAMFVDPSAGGAVLDAACAIAAPTALIAVDRAHLLRWRSPALQAIPYKFSVGRSLPKAESWHQLLTRSPQGICVACDETTPALLTFTSGSTGFPKPVWRSHGFLHQQQQVLATRLALKPGLADLSTLPMFVLANLAAGVTSILANTDVRYPAKARGDRILDQLEAYRPHHLTASPAFVNRVVHASDRHHRSLPDTLHIFCGGAPVFPILVRRLHAIAPAVAVTVVYGASEAEPIALLPVQDWSERDRQATQQGRGILVGRPIPEIQLRIVAAETAAIPEVGSPMALPTGEPGEIVVAGTHVLSDRWHRTGDAGYLDHHGRLWLLGRCAAQIQDHKGMIYPLAVEAAAHDLPTVRQAALVHHRGDRLLLVEWQTASFRLHRPAMLTLRDRLQWANIDRYETWRQIPVDRRHQSKINYPKLYQRLGS
jgi:olefin beta-lactone synthetase